MHDPVDVERLETEVMSTLQTWFESPEHAGLRAVAVILDLGPLNDRENLRNIFWVGRDGRQDPLVLLENLRLASQLVALLTTHVETLRRRLTEELAETLRNLASSLDRPGTAPR